MAAPPHLILLVEDEPDLREVLDELLSGEGCQVACVADGAEALEWLSEGQRPSLVLLDFIMPGMNGWTFLERMRADPAFDAVPVVAISTQAETHPAVSAALRKPFDLPLLVETVQRLARTS